MVTALRVHGDGRLDDRGQQGLPFQKFAGEDVAGRLVVFFGDANVTGLEIRVEGLGGEETQLIGKLALQVSDKGEVGGCGFAQGWHFGLEWLSEYVSKNVEHEKGCEECHYFEDVSGELSHFRLGL